MLVISELHLASCHLNDQTQTGQYDGETIRNAFHRIIGIDADLFMSNGKRTGIRRWSL